MKLLAEFKKFIARGNVIDMAVGIIIGSAFTKIVTSLVNDVVTPAIGILTGKVNVTDLAYTFPNTEVAIKYGSFLQAVIDFLIIVSITLSKLLTPDSLVYPSIISFIASLLILNLSLSILYSLNNLGIKCFFAIWNFSS